SAERLRIAYFRRWARHLGGTLAYEELRGKSIEPISNVRYALSTGLREGWKVVLGFALWWSRDPRSVDRQIAAIAVLEKIRYAMKLNNDPLRRAAVTEAL
ncbi:MAG TPA: hypothetical protein VGQ30_10820, partial [Gemmatimonadaceae bacterium]|nr:hypothetical protein [Gemmatimonadaceae bacterium]